MCIAIAKPKDCIIPTSYLEACFKANPDGSGFAYADNNQLVIEKGFMSFSDFQQAYKPHKDKAAMLHFRITTHGDTNEDNTHPFEVGRNLAMIHNGIIGNVSRTDDMTRSDTYHFNTKVLAPLYKRDSRFIFKDPYADLVKHYIGYSKLVFLNNKGHFKIINDQAGVWDEGVWYSNTSYKPRSFVTQSKKSQTPSALPPPGTSTPTTVLSQGARVFINVPGKQGKGTLMHFTGGLMAGVLIDGDERTSLIPLAALTTIVENHYNNPFKGNDWVIRTDNDSGDIYEVTGTSKDRVWIQKLGDLYLPEGPTYVVNCNRLTSYVDWSGI